jgi:hypothetical protein
MDTMDIYDIKEIACKAYEAIDSICERLESGKPEQELSVIAAMLDRWRSRHMPCRRCAEQHLREIAFKLTEIEDRASEQYRDGSACELCEHHPDDTELAEFITRQKPHLKVIGIADTNRLALLELYHDFAGRF